MGMVMKMVHEVGEFWFEFWWKENGEKIEKKRREKEKKRKISF